MRLERWFPQPLVAILACTAVVGGIFLSGFVPGSFGSANIWEYPVIVGPALAACTAASFRYPIHVRHNVKLYMATIPLYILAVSVAPVPAAIFAGTGWFVGEHIARKHTGAYHSDIFTSTARYCGVVLMVSIFVHQPWLGSYPARLGVGVLLYWIGEAITLPLVICPMNGEPPLQVMVAFIREAGFAEGSQYVVGVLGGLLVSEYAWSLVLLAIPTFLVYGAFKNAKEMRDTTIQMLESMADAVDLRDSYTGGHSRRVAALTAQLLRALDKGGAEADLVVSAARVHDIGKIGLPDAVLLKDGRLTDEEQAVMQSHPEAGAQLLRRYREFSRGIDIVRHHHERWDGAGYPAGLKGQAIPFGARIVAITDSFDAMTSDRPYRKGMTEEAARSVLLAGRGSQWDAEIVDAFVLSLDRARAFDPGMSRLEPALVPAPAL